MDNLKLDYDDICIIPEVTTTITSRKECNCYDENGMLPIFAAPMNTVVTMYNIRTFIENKINAIIPRTEPLTSRLYFVEHTTSFFRSPVFIAFSLAEVKQYFLSEKVNNGGKFYICIDMANGHMEELLKTVKKVKAEYGNNAVIMTGNVANPETYEKYEEAGVDYCRAIIGGGSACLTASNTGTFFPAFSLLKEMYEIKKRINGKCKIIADGGIKMYRDIQKALIYADYVMIGGLFNRALESAGDTTYGKSYWNIRGYKVFRPLKTLMTYGKRISDSKYDKVAHEIKNGTLTVWKKFYGMSTKEAQKAMQGSSKNTKLKTSEGLVKYQKVEYTLKGWVENETDYLRSAMSYTNSRTLEEYKESKWVRINQRRFNN